MNRCRRVLQFSCAVRVAVGLTLMGLGLAQTTAAQTSAVPSGKMSTPVPVQSPTQVAPPVRAPRVPEVIPPTSFLQRLSTDSIPGDAEATLSPQAVKCPTELAAPYDSSKLKVGLYWYAPGQPLAPGGVGCLARADGGAIPGYYDPSKPVLIFVHGWQPAYVFNGLAKEKDTALNTRRENFWYSAGKLNVADAWLRAGWNVAIFHWTQLADDENTLVMPFYSQAKIWTPSYSTDPDSPSPTIGMRYAVPSGYTQQDMPTVSAGELFYQAYKSALSQWSYTGPEPVRVMGHSLGGQMALALAEQAFGDASLPARQLPMRLVLADPYWTPADPVPGQNYDYLLPDLSPAARSARIADQLIKRGAVIEWLQSSAVLQAGGDDNPELTSLMSRFSILPEYLVFNFSAQHEAAPRWYLWSYALPVPKRGISAANPLEAARTLMNERVPYTQFWGRFTADPRDDVLYRPW